MPYLNNPDFARLAICEFLEQQNGACRRLIESFLVFECGYHPNAVTKALRDLKDAKTVVLTQFNNPYGGNACHFYSIGEPNPDALARTIEAYADLRSTLPNELQKRAGEEYVRNLLSHSGLFLDITQRQRLGRVANHPEQLTLDLAATDRQTGHRFGISVKNQHSFVNRGHRAIKDCITRARAHGVRPWLFVAFATPEARVRCDSDGVRLTVLGRQMLPTETENHRVTRWLLPKFKKVFGEQPFDFAYRRFTCQVPNLL